MDPRPAPVVVAVGRHGSSSALEYAAGEALRRGRGLHLVHAVDLLHAGAERHGDAVLRSARDRATTLVAGLVPLSSSLVAAPPVAAVVATATGAPLVVVGRCPESGRTHPYVRSVTGGVAARVEAPVVSVPDSWEDSAGVAPVVVGIDDAGDSNDVLAAGFVAAHERGAPLTVISTWWRPQGADHRALTQVADPTWPERLRAGIDGALVELRTAYPDVAVEVHVRNARPGEVLIEASRGAALVVLGRHDPVMPQGSRLGPVARSVLREAACPVLLATPRQSHLVQRRTGRPVLLASGMAEVRAPTAGR